MCWHFWNTGELGASKQTLCQASLGLVRLLIEDLAVQW